MDEEARAEKLLSDLERRVGVEPTLTPAFEEGELAELAVVVDAVNVALNEAVLDEDKREERLRKWLRRLQSIAERAAEKTGAESFSVSVGFPTSVSVWFSWSPGDG